MSDTNVRGLGRITSEYELEGRIPTGKAILLGMQVCCLERLKQPHQDSSSPRFRFTRKRGLCFLSDD